MPLKAFISLLLIVIVAAGLTVVAAQHFGWPLAVVAVLAVLAALALRIWLDRQ